MFGRERVWARENFEPSPPHATPTHPTDPLTHPPIPHTHKKKQEWALKWTNKLERRVVGFVIASGGTSIEQRGDGGGGGPIGSKGSGVAGKGAADLLAEAQANYREGGLYA